MNLFLNKDTKRLIELFSFFYLLVFITTLVQRVFLKIYGIKYVSESWNYVISPLIIDYIIVLLFFIITNPITLKLLKGKTSWSILTLIHFLFSIFLSICISTSINIFFYFLGEKTSYKKVFIDTLSIIDINIMTYFMISLTTYMYIYFKKNEKFQAENILLEKEVINTRLNLLKSNLQPHFLFNTLNSISSLIEIDKKQAQNTLADLAGLLRDLLKTKDQSTISMQQELESLIKYINILEVRFANHFSFETYISDDVLDAEIPYLLLQPIIENSVKHGYSYECTNLSVVLSIAKNKNNIVITIKNNGTLLPNKATDIKLNIGLQHTIERLKKTYDNNHSFEMKNLDNEKGVITTIILPYIKTTT